MTQTVILFSMKTSTVKLTPVLGNGAALDFSDEVTELSVVPAKTTPTLVVSGKKYTDAADWSVTLALLQNLAKTSLLRALFDHENEKYILEATFKDNADGLRATVTLTPAQIGGTAGNLAASSVSLDCDGKPTWFTPVGD